MKTENGKNTTSGLKILRTALPDSPLPKTKKEFKNDEEFLKVIQQESLELILVLDINGKIKFCNEAVKKLLQLQPFRLKEKNIQQIIPMEQWVAFKAAMRASQEDAIQNIQIDCQLLDAEDKPNDFSIRVKDQRHHPLIEGYLVHGHKINRLKKQEKKLSLYKMAMETVKEGVVIIDPSKQPKVVFANQAFLDITGFSKLDIIGNRINLFKAPYSEMLFTDKTHPKEYKRFLRAINEKKDYFCRIYSRKKNGEIFYNRFTLKPFMDAEDNVINFIATVREIRRRKKKLE